MAKFRERNVVSATAIEFSEGVLEQEHHQIGKKRSPVTKVEGCYDTIGLALSGGGIRSAAYCTGVMQALARHKVFAKIDYLSTVSGGGYAGAVVSVAQARNGGEFPLLNNTGVDTAIGNENSDSPAMQQLRNNANYLKFGSPIEMLYNFAIYLRGLVANLLYVGPILLVLAALTLLWNPDYKSLSRPELPLLGLPTFIVDLGPYAFSAIILAMGFFIYWIWSVQLSPSKNGEFKGPLLKIGSGLLVALGLAVFIEIQPLVVKAMFAAENPVPVSDTYSAFFSNLATFITPALAVISFAGNYLGGTLKTGEGTSDWLSLSKRFTSKGILYLAGVALPILLWLVYLRLVYWGVDIRYPGTYVRGSTPYSLVQVRNQFSDFVVPTALKGWNQTALLYLTVAAILSLTWFFLRPNGNSLNRLYRDRLSNAFCFYMKGRDVELANTISLSELDGNRPYPLINTALNIQRAKEVNQKGRNADFFVFSPLFIGSDATGYVNTKLTEDSIKRNKDRRLDFATAIAISGAAASANMGSYSLKFLSVSLALLNVRLGYWFPNPRKLAKLTVSKARNLRNLLYFVREAFGALDLNHEVVYLTDGGHIENLGVYELLRRRCKLIIAVDAEADKAMNFPSFIKLQRYARIDLGVNISMDWSALKQASNAPSQDNDTSKKERDTSKKDRDTPKKGPHCAIGRIDYAEGGKGILLYIKASVTGDEYDYVRDYSRRYLDYPHETTSDQFFSEEQFEVYRALGHHAADGMLSGEHLVQTKHKELESLRAPDAEGYGVKEIRDILGLKVIPHSDESKDDTQGVKRIRPVATQHHKRAA